MRRASEQLTDTQRAVLTMFERRAAAGDPPPTLREIATEFRWSSATAAKGHVVALARKGKLKVSQDGAARGASLSQPLLYRAPLIIRLDGRGPSVELAIPTYLLPESGVHFVFQQQDNTLASMGILAGDLVLVGSEKSGAKPKLRVVSQRGIPHVRSRVSRNQKVYGVVVGITRSLVAEAMTR
jgi:SOS-response transcriptional repressor LexA